MPTPLRNRDFFSLQDLNSAIIEELTVLNTKAFQGKNYSRKDLFEEKKSTYPFGIISIYTAKN